MSGNLTPEPVDNRNKFLVTAMVVIVIALLLGFVFAQYYDEYKEQRERDRKKAIEKYEKQDRDNSYPNFPNK